ncbi:MAG TPA: hypothetical protein VMV05_07375 [bacterium]|nr:hypothetical protein [bacterium]
MSNKLFFMLVGLTLASFFGWMAYDAWTTSSELKGDAAHQGLLMDSGGSMAGIQYVFRMSDPQYHHDLSTAQIEQLSQTVGSGEKYHVYGLTQADYETETHYQVNWSKKWFREEYSLWVENLRVDFSYNTLNVYVSSAYPEGSCEYQATLEHENQHVEIHKQIFIRFQKVIRDTLGAAPNLPLSSNPLLVTSIEDGKKKVGETISGILDPVFDQFKSTLTEEQAKIDTPESYNELRQRCQHW